MVRTFRYPLEPNRAQKAVLEQWRVACQQLYNGALQERRDAWVKQRVSVDYNRQTTELTELRAQDASFRDVPVEVQRSALRRLHRAFQAFFRRVKAGEKPGYPRFRSRDRYQSFGLGRARVDGDRVHVPKLGAVKFRRYRDPMGEVLDVQVGRDADRWWLYVSCDLGAAPAKVPVRNAVGIDVGLSAFATLSDGTKVENPRFFRAGEDLLAKRQRALSTKRRGSNSRARAKRLVARAHLHVRNQRRDFAWKLAGELVRRYDLVAHEDLAVARMVHGNLAKSIHDAAWGLFLHALTCKAEEAGKWAVPVDPRGTSQRCSACGAVVGKDLSVRVHRCACGCVLDRDHNAALNVVALGRSAAAVEPKGY